MTAKIGLTLGKYAPLHRGHQLVIETALAEMDELFLVIYDCPEITPVPLPVRAGWLRRLYPQAHVIEAWDGSNEVGDTPEIKRMHETYLLNLLAPYVLNPDEPASDVSASHLPDTAAPNQRRITHFYCSEFYGEHISQAFRSVSRLVDCDRSAFPVSGTAIRANPYENRAYLHPLVYRDLITNVVFLGAPSTGKSTLAERLALELNTVWIPEYGREYWEAHQNERRLTLEQLVEIAEGHLEREETLLTQANGVLFTDTNALTTRLFSLYYHGAVDPRLEQLAQQCASRYDLVFVCADDIPYDATWDRSGDANRRVFQKQIIADLLTRKIPFFTLRGDLENRVAQVKAVLQRHPKYTSVCLNHDFS